MRTGSLPGIITGLRAEFERFKEEHAASTATLRDLLRRMRDPSVRMSSCRASKRDSKASRCSKGAAGSERDSKSEGGSTPSNSRKFGIGFGNQSRKLSVVGEDFPKGGSSDAIPQVK